MNQLVVVGEPFPPIGIEILQLVGRIVGKNAATGIFIQTMTAVAQLGIELIVVVTVLNGTPGTPGTAFLPTHVFIG
jgi:hypothetical protein